MLEHCGLAWDPALSRVQRKRAAGADRQRHTGAPADLPQSVERWRVYAKWLGPLLQELGLAAEAT